MARRHAVEAALKLPVAGDELAASRRQAHAAARGALRGTLDELESRGLLQLFQVSPGVAVRHAELCRRLTERASLVDQLEQSSPAVAELESLAEDDPDSQLGLHCANTVVRPAGVCTSRTALSTTVTPGVARACPGRDLRASAAAATGDA